MGGVPEMGDLGVEGTEEAPRVDSLNAGPVDGEYRVLLRVVEIVNSAAPIGSVVSRSMAVLGEALGGQDYAIWLAQEALPHLSLAFAARSRDGQALARDHWVALSRAAGDPALAAVERSRAPLLLTASLAGLGPSPSLLALLGPGNLLGFPLRVKEKLLGVALLAVQDGPPLRDPSLLAVCQAAISGVAGAIDSARLAEREHSAQKEKDDFISMVSHELKTPLTSISGYAQLVIRRLPEDSDAVLRDYLSVIVEKTRDLTRLINDLLNLAQHTPHNLVLEWQEINLSRLVREAAHAAQALSDRHHLLVDSPESLTVLGDPLRLRQVLDHLLSNAVKYSPSGGAIHVRVALEPAGQEDGRPRAMVSISDPGIGVPPLHLPHIFEPFYGADLADDRHYSGLGVGLSVCRKVVEQHGGRIWVESQPGSGSTFRFSIPLPLPAAPRPLG